jgi:hypothetical protein
MALKIKNKRQNKKHFIAINSNGVLFFTKPKDWSRANQNYFPKCNFNSDKTPTVEQIEKILLELGYNRVDNSEIVIFYKYDTI